MEDHHGTLVVNFWGICTFMTNQVPETGVPESAAWGNRYVLVNASDQATIADNRHLPEHLKAHFAELQIAMSDIVTASNTFLPGFSQADFSIFEMGMTNRPFVAWRLNNVLLSVANAIPEPSTSTPHFPHLSQFVVPPEQLGPPALDTTMQPIPTRAAAYFDFFGGELECRSSHGGACMGHLRIKTLGNPQIRVHSFTSNTSILSVELRSGSEIVVGNGPENPKDDADEDFLLHYLTCSRFPNVQLDLDSCGCPALETYNPPRWDPKLMVTPGCSNSNYP